MGTQNRKPERKVEWLWDWYRFVEWQYRYPIIKVTSRDEQRYVQISFVRDWWNLWNLDFRIRTTLFGVEIETYDRDRV